MLFNRLASMALLLTIALSPLLASADSNQTAAEDHAIVQAMLRIPKAKLKDYPERSESVMRYLSSLVTTDPGRYVKIVRQLGIRANSDQLAEIATGDGQAANDAANQLFRFDQQELLRKRLEQGDDRKVASLATTIGYVNTEQAAAMLEPIMLDSSRHSTVRSAAASALGHSWWGQQVLLKLARGGKIPDGLQFEFSDALLGSSTKEIAAEASKIAALKPAVTRSAEPIPPVSKLARMSGNPNAGKKVFETNGECSKCHKVLGQGKEVGPDLSEIGSKLSREDLYVSILNPSAGISHNYETYACLTADGQVITGILVSQTDDGVTIKSSDALLKEIAADDIEELKKQEISLMPADVQKNLTVQNLVDLVDYLRLLKKPDEKAFDAVTVENRGLPSREPKDAIAGFKIAPGLKVQLMASEPQMLSPSSIDIDHLGRIWVCEVVNYRKFRNPDNETRSEGDRILVMEDTDGDATIDKTTVFYQGTDIDSPHGICVLGDRVIVSVGENVISFRDFDGDLKPDEKTLMFTGISGSQHDHGIHSFMPGPDGKLYFNFGNEGKQLRDGQGKPIIDRAGNEINDSRKPYRQGMVFRCDLDGSNVETLGWNFRNNWEVCVDSFGTMWQSDNDDDGNRGTRINYVMEFGNYGYRDEQTDATWNVQRIGMHEEIGKRHWHLNDPGVVPNLLQTGAGSPTGMTFYEGNLLPEIYRNQMIHTDPGPNVVRAYPVENYGAGYTAKIENMVQGVQDPWFRPVDACTASDGSIVVADWYDPGVGGHRMGDTTHGRLFRITIPGHETFKTPRADFSTLQGASSALASPNQSTRFLAGEAIKKFWASDPPKVSDYVGRSGLSPTMQARWLWLLAKTTATQQEAIATGLASTNSDLRIAAIRAARQTEAVDDLTVVSEMIDDPSPQVRRELAIALRGKNSSKAAQLWTKLALKHDGNDRWYLEALGIGAEGNWDACFDNWLQQVGDAWSQSRNRDIVWRARTPKACDYLAKLIQSSATPNEQTRYFRALDFFNEDVQQKALAVIVGR